MSSRCEIRIRTSSFVDFPQPGLTEEEKAILSNSGFNPKNIENLKNKYAGNSRALKQLDFYIAIKEKSRF